MALDDLFLQIGELGRYQWYLVILASLGTTICPVSLFSQYFYTLHTPHWCAADNALNSTECALYGLDDAQCAEAQKNVTIPWTEEEGYAECEMYNTTGGESYSSYTNLSVIECQNGWVFDESETGRTLTTQYELVCDRENLIHLSQSLYFVGCLLGNAVYGTLSDRYGRLTSWAICIFQSLVFAVAILFTKTFWLYNVSRVLMGMANYALWIVPFVYLTEVVGHNKRMFVGLLVEFFWAGAYLLVTALSWVIRDWFYIQIIVVVYHVVLFPIVLLLCESPRWLLAVGKIDKAEEVVEKIAKRNGREMPKNYREDLQEEKKKIEEEAEAGHDVTPIEIFRNKTIFIWTVIMMVIWFAHGMTYWAITFISGDLGFNFYPSFFIQAAVEVPAYVFCIILLAYVGRRPPTVVFMLAAGILCLLAIPVPLGAWKAVVVFAAKFCISISFVIMFVYSTEIYPTCIRGFGVSILVNISIFGQIMAPVVMIIAKYWPPFPLVFGGLLSMLGGALASFLPETRGTMLPETMEEAASLGRDKQRIPSEDAAEVAL